jgi:hypothetical protein
VRWSESNSKSHLDLFHFNFQPYQGLIEKEQIHKVMDDQKTGCSMRCEPEAQAAHTFIHHANL